jgi:hypothetical protein
MKEYRSRPDLIFIKFACLEGSASSNMCSSMCHCKMVGENMVPAHDGCKAHVSYTQEMHDFVVERCKAGVVPKIILEGTQARL